ncbi:FG-GAP repeat domain-containing protein [Streptomyces vietnamensis]|uniref:FG-GAP repeat domain-containing protein n=1 Tax=Streptomyces vietnamensis TaxID=362257 RepID=UPI000697D09A|nr:VCBS repeat-containing protein [Streptomyces vietnamensis]
MATGDGSQPWESQVVTVRDMASPSAEPVQVDLRALGEHYFFGGMAGSTLIAHDRPADGVSTVRLVTVADGRVTDRAVPGLPGGDCWFADAYAPGLAVFNCATSDAGLDSAVVDLATDTVVDMRPASESVWWPNAVSTTHVAWQELDDRGQGRIAVSRLGSTDVRYVEGTGIDPESFRLLGGWVLSGYRVALEQRAPYAPGRPFLARHPETGETIELLTHYSSAVPAPDGSLLVRGGTLDRNEGLYRVSLDGNGKPRAELVATTGQSTAVTYLGTTVPSTFTFDRIGQGADLTWQFSRTDTDVWLTLVHERTGERLQRRIWSTDPEAVNEARRDGQTISWRWDGSNPVNPLKAAYNGAYTWEIKAVPDDGIGPEAKASGRFTVNRAPVPHDYDDNGTPDILLHVDGGGALLRADTNKTASGDSVRHVLDYVPRVGVGWGIYDRIESVGDVAGTRVDDVVGRDENGVLWLYQGTGNGDEPLRGRVRVGSGWGIYDQLAGGSDLTGDGRSDLVATDKAGVLWLYKGTGNASAPFGARKKVGGGWGVYNQLTATGNLAGAGAGDLVARDKDGVLWLYLGKGDGTFAARTRVGGGWNAYPHVVAIGDGTGDGRADLVAFDAKGRSYTYAGTGDYRAPLKGRVEFALIADQYWLRLLHVL